MRRTALATLLLLLLSTVEASAQRRSYQVVDEVGAMAAAYSDAVNSGDWDGVLELYADDPRFSWTEVGRTTYESKEQIAAAMEQAQGIIESMQVTLRSRSITPLSDTLAWVRAEYDQTMTFVPEGIPTVQTRVAMSAVAIRTEAGWRWLVGQVSTLAPDRD